MTNSASILANMARNPVIAAVRREKDVLDALKAQGSSVFLLHADIFTLGGLVAQFRSAGKDVFVHVDLLDGIGRDATAIRWLAEVIRPTGILTTKSQHVRSAQENGLFAIQRFFLIDHQSFDMAVRTVHASKPDLIELMPARMPEIIRDFRERTPIPVIAGGLISTKQDILEALQAGAQGVSTGDPALWNV